MPLPDGATLVTFQDVTDTVNVERALRERNEALETADGSRSTSCTTFRTNCARRSPTSSASAHFLGDPATGPLTDKQHEYLGYITVSTNALLAIINNILDLATIDAGAMTPQSRSGRYPQDHGGRRRRRAGPPGQETGSGSKSAPRRISAASSPTSGGCARSLFNLLANAVGFSPAGETVTLSAQRLKDAVVFSVTDRGPGIPADVQDKVFDWFETHSLGSRHRGTGLGLSLVRSFVELHGGTVTLDSAVGRGTTVTCVFPIDLASQRTAAE